MRVLIVCSGNHKNFSFEINQAFIYDQITAIQLNSKEFEIYNFYIKGKGIKGYLNNYWRLIKCIKDNKIDLIHAHFALSSIFANLQRRIPVVTTFHGSDINNPQTRVIASLAFILSKASIFVNDNLLKKVFSINSKSSAKIIPCGVDLSTFYPISKIKARNIMHLDITKTYFLFSSNFDNKIKNFQLLKNSMKYLNYENIEILELVNYTRSSVNLLLNAVDLAIMTSLSEGSPQFIKEAMACNCPIVSTNVGDVKYVIGNTIGCYMVSFDEKDVFKKILLALDFAKTEGRTNGRQRIMLLGLDSETVAKRIIEIYLKARVN